MELGAKADERTRLTTEANYLLSVKKDRAKASAAFEQLVTRYPRDLEGLFALTNMYREDSKYDRSVEYGNEH
jgi:lipopolysaccharide biosynthesis regulator YciM